MTKADLQIDFFRQGKIQRRRIGATTEDEAHQRRRSSPLAAAIVQKMPLEDMKTKRALIRRCVETGRTHSKLRRVHALQRETSA